MFTLALRRSALAIFAVAAMGAALPAFAGGYNDPQVIFTDDYGQNGVAVTQRHHRPEVLPDFQPQDLREDYGLLSQRDIVRQLRRQGYGKVQEISLSGSQYRVVAIRNNGALVRLMVDGETGEILSERRVGWVRNSQVREPLYPVAPRPRPRSGFSIEFGFGEIR